MKFAVWSWCRQSIRALGPRRLIDSQSKRSFSYPNSARTRSNTNWTGSIQSTDVGSNRYRTEWVETYLVHSNWAGFAWLGSSVKITGTNSGSVLEPVHCPDLSFSQQSIKIIPKGPCGRFCFLILAKDLTGIRTWGTSRFCIFSFLFLRLIKVRQMFLTNKIKSEKEEKASKNIPVWFRALKLVHSMTNMNSPTSYNRHHQENPISIRPVSLTDPTATSITDVVE